MVTLHSERNVKNKIEIAKQNTTGCLGYFIASPKLFYNTVRAFYPQASFNIVILFFLIYHQLLTSIRQNVYLLFYLVSSPQYYVLVSLSVSNDMISPIVYPISSSFLKKCHVSNFYLCPSVPVFLHFL